MSGAAPARGLALPWLSRPGQEKRQQAGEASVPDLGALDDATLMIAIAEGDHEAFRVLYDRRSGLAFSFALRLTGDPDLAQDVVADAFLRVWRQARSYRQERGSLIAWLAGIIRHLALDEARARRQHPLTALTELDERAAGGTHDPSEVMVVREALARLTPPQRVVLELAYFEGLSQRAIAERTGMPLGTVSSHTLRGLRALRRALGG